MYAVELQVLPRAGADEGGPGDAREDESSEAEDGADRAAELERCSTCLIPTQQPLPQPAPTECRTSYGPCFYTFFATPWIEE